MQKIDFSYQAPIAGKFDVFLVADFNQWERNSLKLSEKSGIYSITLELKEGTYHYYFLVNGKKVLDPFAQEGMYNNEKISLLTVGECSDFINLVTFETKDIDSYTEVSIVGDFNNWKPNANKLYNTATGFRSTLFLKQGLYQYKFLANAGRWFTDDDYRYKKSDLNSKTDSKNAVLDIGANDYPLINPSYVEDFDTNTLVFKQNILQIYRYKRKSYEFKATLPKLDVERIELYLNKQVYQLEYVADNDDLMAYNIIIANIDIDLIYSYRLVIVGKNFLLYANEKAISNSPEFNSIFAPRDYNIIHLDENLENEIIYQIMPDRFCNGDSSLNPSFQEEYYDPHQSKPQLLSLKKNQEYYHYVSWDNTDILQVNPFSAQADPDWFAFYGGDLAGIRQKIPYLKSLGITLIYLNPIFRAKSPHRYDSIDFLQIDPHLGNNEFFKSLVQELHENNIKVIIDVALNHCGFDFFAFKDCIEKGDKSKYWNWFDWKQWPLPDTNKEDFTAEDYYQCWWGIKDLPEFNYDLSRGPISENRIEDISQASPNINLVNYLLSAMRFWIKDMGIDGFRLDVPEEVPFWFWKLFRVMVKSVNPKAYLVGEIWNDSQIWLKGTYFDAIMNYHSFKDPAISFFVHKNISLKSFVNKLSEAFLYIPEIMIKSQMNLLGSHDTVRIRELIKDDFAKEKLLLIFQFTFIGIPHIYYGDEVALEGTKDPDNRRPFPWNYKSDNIRVTLLDFYRDLIKLRKKHKLFREGKIIFINHPFLLIFIRWTSSSKERIIVILNNSTQTIDISNFIAQYPNAILQDCEEKVLSTNGYYLAMTSS